MKGIHLSIAEKISGFFIEKNQKISIKGAGLWSRNSEKGVSE